MPFGTSYFDNIILKHFRRDLREIKKQGCGFIVLTFSEANLCYHTETFRQMAAEAKGEGLTVIFDPWAVGNAFGGEALSQLPIWHDEERQVRSDGKRAPALCLNQPALTAYLKKWIDTVSTFETDYVIWDEPHFYLNWMDGLGGWEPNPEAWSCRCGTCQKRFREETGKEMPLEETHEVKEFKCRCVRDFLLSLSGYAAGKGLKNALTLLPSDPAWFLEAMAKDPDIHMMGGEAYFEEANRPTDIYQYAVDHTRIMKKWSDRYHKPLLMWVRGFRITAGNEADVVPAIEGCVQAGAEYVALWGFEACKHVSSIACVHADKVWRLAGQTFQRLGGRPKTKGKSKEKSAVA